MRTEEANIVIELFGGPLDGTIAANGPSHTPGYLVVTSHIEHPIYRRTCCYECAVAYTAVPYVFVGYEPRKTILDCDNAAGISRERQ